MPLRAATPSGGMLAPAPHGAVVHLPDAVPTTLYTSNLDRGMYISGALAFLVWDMLLTMPAEIRMYRNRGWKWRVTPAFLTARYLAPVCVGLYINIVRSSSWTASQCYHTGRASVFAGAIITSAASFIFGVRTWAMWRCNRAILAVIAVLWAGQLAANMVICNWLRPQLIELGVCVFVMPGHEVFWAYYVCNIIYDTIITLLAFAALFVDQNHNGDFVIRIGLKQCGIRQSVQQRLITDGLIYFAVALTINLINALFFSHSWEFEDINGSLANAVTAICSYRLVLLKLGSDLDLRRGAFGSRSHGSGSGQNKPSNLAVFMHTTGHTSSTPDSSRFAHESKPKDVGSGGTTHHASTAASTLPPQEESHMYPPPPSAPAHLPPAASVNISPLHSGGGDTTRSRAISQSELSHLGYNHHFMSAPFPPGAEEHDASEMLAPSKVPSMKSRDEEAIVGFETSEPTYRNEASSSCRDLTQEI